MTSGLRMKFLYVAVSGVSGMLEFGAVCAVVREGVGVLARAGGGVAVMKESALTELSDTAQPIAA